MNPDAGAALHPFARAGPARAEPPCRQPHCHRVDIAHCAAPVAITVSECAPIGNGTDKSPPWAATSRRNRSIAVPSRSVCAGSRPSIPASSSISAGQPQRQLHHVGRTAAGQHVQRLGNLERIADGRAQRAVHVGQQRAGGHPVRRAQARPWCAPARGTALPTPSTPRRRPSRRAPARPRPRPASCSSPSWRSAAADSTVAVISRSA